MNRKTCPPQKGLYFALFLLCSLQLFAQPSITGFTPASGPVGTTVTISGSNFSTLPSGNTVYFGAVKATVVSAGTSALVVNVPYGASYQPLSVTVNNLTGYAKAPFIVTFPDATLSGNGFSGPASLTTGYYPQSVVAVDLDGDGKPDLASANNANSPYSTFSVLRNASSSGQINFLPSQEFLSDTMPSGMAAGDLDGDGRQDLVITNVNGTFSIFRNTSSTGAISFAPKLNYSTGQNPLSVSIGDLNGDGKPDVVIANYMASTISVYRNTSTPGAISFTAQPDVTTGIGPRKIVLADFDGDGKLDMAVTNNLANTISVFRNTSSLTSVSFTTKTDYAVSYGPWGIAAGDLDSDGKADLAVVNGNDATLSLFRNNSSIGSLSFVSGGILKLSDFNAYSGYNVAITDMDGDGKPDLCAAGMSDVVVVLKNQSTTGTLSFARAANLFVYDPFDLAITDLDGDGKPDVAASIHSSNNLAVFRNITDVPVIQSFTPLSAPAGATVTITGFNFNGVTGVRFGGVAATSFTQPAPDTIIAVVGSGVSGDVSVTTKYGTGSLSGFVFQGPPIVSSFTPDSAASGAKVTITGNNFSSVSSVSFGGVPATYFTVDATTQITAYVAGTGASGFVKVVNAYGADSLNGFYFIPPPVIASFSPQQAQQDSVVTITGTGFSNASSVSFGGIAAASFTVVSSTTIKAVPASGSSGTITVITPGGTATVNNFVFLPTILSFTPARAANGTTITITGKNFTGITDVKIGGSSARNIQVLSSTTITAVVNTSASGNVTVYTSGGSVSLPGFSFIPRPVISSSDPMVGGRGSVVTIRGVNFTNAQEVHFGGVPSDSFSVLNDTTIRAIVGPGASGYVYVSTPGGQDSLYWFTFTSHAVINSFSPASGPVGTIVTIRGANFSTNPANDAVYFGAVRAEVISSSANVLQVKVPLGTTFQPITVATDGYVAASVAPFNVTFPGPGTFTAASFNGKTDFATGAEPQNLAIGDVDGDGKPDVVVANKKDQTISIFKNTSVAGTFSFAQRIDIPAGPVPRNINLSDIDGDGRLDILFLNLSSADYPGDQGSTLSVMRNTGTPGSIQFGPRQIFSTGYNPSQMVIGDLDGDSKPDIAIVNNGQQIVTVYSNDSRPEGITFKQRQDFPIFQYEISYQGPSTIALADVNRDGKMDLVVGSVYSLHPTYLINNSYTWPSFTEKEGQDMMGSGSFLNITAADFDQDGWTDFITEDYYFHNKAPFYGNMQIDVARIIGVGGVSAVGDLNGDGWPDYARIRYGDSSLSVFRNMSTPGAIQMDTAIRYPVETDMFNVAIGDLDGDGNPDIAVTNRDAGTFSILHNQNAAQIITVCAGTSAALPQQAQANTYQWQINTGSGFVNLNDDTTYSGTTTGTLHLNNIPSALNGAQYRSVTDTTYGPVYTLVVNNSGIPLVSITAQDTAICSISQAVFTATTVNGGTNPSYYWMVNGTIKDSSGYQFTSLLNDKDQVQLMMNSNKACVGNAIATSNTIAIQVVPTVIPTGKASAPPRACSGTNYDVLFTPTQVPVGTTVQLLESVNGTSFTATSSQVYNSGNLRFSLTAPSSGNKWYYFTLTPPAGKCIQSYNTDTVGIAFDYLKAPLFAAIGSDFTIISPDSLVTYTWQLQGSNGSWSDIALPGSGAKYTATISGNYRLKATYLSCIVYSDPKSAVVTAIDAVSISTTGMVFYPNPASTYIHFDSLRLTDHWETVEITDLNGLHIMPLMNISNRTSFSMHIEPLSAGVYIAVLRKKNGQAVLVKFVKM